MFVFLIIAFIAKTSACSLNNDVTEPNYRRQRTGLPRSTNFIDGMPTPPPPTPPPTSPPTTTTENIMDLMEGRKDQDGPDGAANRFEVVETTVTVKRRTAPPRVTLEEECDYLAYYCLKAYKTGKICGRTLYYNYQNFKNYCMLDYVNCMERYEVWQIVHMGECFEIEVLKEYQHYEYHDDFFLDQVYVIQE